MGSIRFLSEFILCKLIKMERVIWIIIMCFVDHNLKIADFRIMKQRTHLSKI